MTTSNEAFPNIAEIIPNRLYLTDFQHVQKYLIERCANVSEYDNKDDGCNLLVINVACSECIYEESLLKRAKYVEIWELDLKDHYGCDISNSFDDVSDRINHSLSKNSKVLIHCFAGKSRYAALVLAYLMKYQHHSLQSAMNHICRLRNICPNIKFIYDLLAYEEKLRKNDSESIRDNLVFDLKSYVCNFVVEVLSLPKEDIYAVEEAYNKFDGDFDRIIDSMLCS